MYYETCQYEPCGKPIPEARRKKYSKFCSPDCLKGRTRARYEQANPRATRWRTNATHCRRCNTVLSDQQRRKHCVFCSRACRNTYARERWKEVNPRRLQTNPSHVGAAHEMVVVADLMLKGYQVFRAVSPACPCDLAILRETTLLRVQVTTGYQAAHGRLTWPTKLPGTYDLLAIVHGDRQIRYIPETF